MVFDKGGFHTIGIIWRVFSIMGGGFFWTHVLRIYKIPRVWKWTHLGWDLGWDLQRSCKVVIPPIYDDLGDGLYVCFTHIICDSWNILNRKVIHECLRCFAKFDLGDSDVWNLKCNNPSLLLKALPLLHLWNACDAGRFQPCELYLL